MPANSTSTLRDALADVVGAENVITDPGRLLVYESDALTRYRSRPAGVVLPASTEETSRVVRILADAGIPIVARGAGTGLSGGAVAGEDAFVVGLARMNRILDLDGPRRLARVEAGVVNAELSRRVAPMGLYYAPDPSSQTACTLGGNVAENSGGPHCLKYGVTTRYVTGLTMIRADGEIVTLGGAHRRDPVDLTGLVVGSEGCFGIVTEIEVRLLPKPAAVRTLLGIFDSAATAGAAVSAIVARGLLPAALEIIDRATIAAVEASAFAAGYPTGAGAALVVEFDGVEAGLDADADHAAEICREFGAIEVRRAADDAERARLWQGRKKAFGAMGRIAPDLMVQDATVPRSVLPEVLARIDEIAARYRLRVANVFHAGDGNLHPNILFDRRDTEESERVEAASSEIMRACVEAGGTITGEHGVGLDKRHYMSLVHGPAELAAMGAVRRAFDPRGLLNPGKVLPEGESRFEGPDHPVGVGDVREYRPEDLTVTVAGEMRWSDLEARTRAEGQWVPWAGRRREEATVAEVVSAGGWSPFAERYGGLRDLVLGARVATGAGGALRLGGRVVKNVAGFDLLRPVIGSGCDPKLIEEVTLRLYPIPAVRGVLEFELESDVREDALALLLEGLPVLPAFAFLVDSGDGRRGVVGFDGGADEVEELTSTVLRRVEGRIPELDRAKGEARVIHPAELVSGVGVGWIDGWVTSGSEEDVTCIVAGPASGTSAELRSSLETLIREESESAGAVHDLLTDRVEWKVRGLRPDTERWTGLAERWREAGGEVRAFGESAPLTAALDRVRFSDPLRTGAAELSLAVRGILLEGS